MFHAAISAPDPPSFTIKEIDNLNFSLTWEVPKFLPGTLEQCDIVIDWKPRYSIPVWCGRDEPSISVNCSVDTFTYDLQDLKPFATYKVKMRAKTNAVEWSEYSEQNFSTMSTGTDYFIRNQRVMKDSFDDFKNTDTRYFFLLEYWKH